VLHAGPRRESRHRTRGKFEKAQNLGSHAPFEVASACFNIPLLLQRHEKVSRALLGGSQGGRYDNDVFPRSTPSHLFPPKRRIVVDMVGIPGARLADYQSLVLMARHSSCATFFRDAKTFKCRSCLLLHAARRSEPDNLYGCRFH